MDYAKRDSSNPSELMNLEYELLADKMKMLVKSDGLTAQNYYTKRKNEIEMSWLEDSVTNQDKNYVWHANMPLPLTLCKEIFLAAKKMPKNAVTDLIFPDYDLNANEMALFDVIYSYGRARGLFVVAEKLFDGAEAGDPRAIKMYLDMLGHINQEDDEEDRVKKLMRVSMNI